ncbi:hypothetical protein EB796_003539 [Bugula neritina]|uniref:protein-tyrosine-phosphatase n=1 Tax=Bugula neritina TaxID=10212 RepID=A0A7J7KJP9_BUGNE|nr:hypothetical protein EB796_003539 [Bugula neritina]
MELNLCRDVVHFQYLDFPSKGTPSSVCNFLTFIKDARPYMEISHGPTVVHCSTGTGRTGTFLAIERCLQTYDDSYTVDVMNCVYRLRQDRAGAVHTTAHYAFIYKTMLEYANMTGGSNSPSKWSSRSSVSV